MGDFNDIILVDGTDYPLAEYLNKLFSHAVRPEYANTQTITGTKSLTDADYPFQFLTASGGDQNVRLAPEGTGNHITVVFNSGASNNLVAQDDSGATTFATLAPDEFAICYPLNAEGWRVQVFRAETEYKLSVSVSSNDLIVSVKHLDGSDPSVFRPLMFLINGVKRYATAALSITIVDGTSWFGMGAAELATKEVDLFPYAVWDSNSSVVALTLARIPYASLVSDFNATTTHEKHCYNYANFTTTDDVKNIGRLAATLSAGAGYTWTVPTFTSSNLKHEPTFETRRLDWVPTLTGYSVAPTSTVYQYAIIGRCLEAYLREGGDGTSSGTTTAYTAPFTALTLTNGLWMGVGSGVDNSAPLTTTCRLTIGTASNSISAFPNMSFSATWTGSGGKRIAAGYLRFPIG